MSSNPTDQWQQLLGAITEAARRQDPLSADLQAEVTDAARSVDPTDLAEVEFTLRGLMGVVDAGQGWDVGWIIDEAFSLALLSLRETSEIRCVLGLARQLHRRGMTDIGVMLIDEALTMDALDLPGSDPADAGQLLNTKGEFLREIGRPAEAAPAYLAALELLGSDTRFDSERSVVLNNLGLNDKLRGDLPEALKHLQESLDIEERLGSEGLSIAVTLDNLGALESQMAEEAGPLWVDEDHVNAEVDRHLRQAEEYFERARSLFEATLPESSEDYVRSLLNETDVAAQLGDHDRLDRLTARAVEVAADQPVSDAARWAAADRRGDFLLRDGRAERAVALLMSWFKRLAPRMEPTGDVSAGFATLLRAASATGDQSLVDGVAQMLVQNDASILPMRLVGGSSDAHRAFASFRGRAGLVVGRCLPPTPNGIAPDWVYEVVINSKGLLLEREGSAWHEARRLEGSGAGLLDRVRELRAAVALVDLEGAGEEAIQTARRRHRDAELMLRDAEVELDSVLAPEGWTVPRLTVTDVQAGIPPDAVLLDIVVTEARDGTQRYVMFEVRPDGPVRYRDVGAVDEVDDRMTTLSAALEKPPDDETSIEERAASLGALLPSVFEHGDVLPERLLVSGTGSWGGIPFGLIEGPSGRPLIDDHVVTLVPSARWLAGHAADDLSGTDPRPTGSPVVIGDPDYDLGLPDDLPFPLSVQLERLEMAADEARTVAGLLGVPPVLGEEATRGRLLAIHRPGVLHLACHAAFIGAIASIAEQSEPREWTMESVAGVVVTREVDEPLWTRAPQDGDNEDPAAAHASRVAWLLEIGPAGQLSRSALFLAGFNAWVAAIDTPAEIGSGMLTAGEFALLELVGTDLVVLSACETGVGAVDAADGSLIGLRTAALAAGAARCVSTLWPVIDEAAATAMSVFYGRLREGDDAGRALRAAQLDLRKRLPDPYYWASWVAEGSTASIAWLR